MLVARVCGRRELGQQPLTVELVVAGVRAIRVAVRARIQIELQDRTVVSPRTEADHACLLIERKVVDIDQAGRFVESGIHE